VQPPGAATPAHSATSASAAPLQPGGLASGSSSSWGSKAPHDLREARAELRRQGLENFVDSVLADAEATWRRRLLFCGPGEMRWRAGATGGCWVRRLCRRRPPEVLEALLTYVQEFPSRGDRLLRRPRLQKKAGTLAVPTGAATRGFWRKKKSGYRIQLRVRGVLVAWRGVNAREGILARALAHSIVSATASQLKQGRHRSSLDDLSKALVANASRVEACDFDGWPLPLKFAACVEVGRSWKQPRVHSRYYTSVHKAMRARRLQQGILDSHGSAASHRAYNREVRRLDQLEALAKRPGPQKLARLRGLLLELAGHCPMQGATRKQSAPGSCGGNAAAPEPPTAAVHTQGPLASELRREILSYLHAPPVPLCARLDRVVGLRREGVLSPAACGQAMWAEIRAEMLVTGGGMLSVPAWFRAAAHGLGHRGNEVPNLWALMVQYPEVQDAVCRALGNARGGSGALGRHFRALAPPPRVVGVQTRSMTQRCLTF